MQAIGATEVALCRAITESLQTHYHLQHLKDLAPAVDVIYNSGVGEDILCLFATITHRWMGIAKHCLIHNHLVDDYITGAKWDQLVEHLHKGKEMCQEIYLNDQLVDEQALALKWRLRWEFLAVKSAIHSWSPDSHQEGETILPIPYRTGAADEIQSLTEVCYKGVCVAKGQLGLPLEVSRRRFILDRPNRKEVTPIRYRYDILELLDDLLTGHNRYSGKPIDPTVSSQLCQTYSSELAMLRCYHSWLEGR